jgi:hypothetical protein
MVAKLDIGKTSTAADASFVCLVCWPAGAHAALPRRQLAQSDAGQCRALFNQVGGVDALARFMPACTPSAYNAQQCCRQAKSALSLAPQAGQCELLNQSLSHSINQCYTCSYEAQRALAVSAWVRGVTLSLDIQGPTLHFCSATTWAYRCVSQVWKACRVRHPTFSILIANQFLALLLLLLSLQACAMLRCGRKSAVRPVVRALEVHSQSSRACVTSRFLEGAARLLGDAEPQLTC